MQSMFIRRLIPGIQDTLKICELDSIAASAISRLHCKLERAAPTNAKFQNRQRRTRQYP